MNLTQQTRSLVLHRLSGKEILSWAADAGAWMIGLVLAVLARYEFDLAAVPHAGLAFVVVVAIAVHTAVGCGQYLYRGRFGFGTFEEVRAVLATVTVTVLALLTLVLTMAQRPAPASAPIIGGPFALMIMAGVRYIRRLERERRRRPDARTVAPVLLFGAGDAASQLIASMLRDPRSRYLPVGLLDDDPAKRRLRVAGVPVMGGRRALPVAIELTGARTVIFAVSNADAELVRDVRQIVLSAGAAFKVLPSVSELLDAQVRVSDVRDVQISDLLGRHQIETDVESIAGYLTGKRVLVTGAGGSIGSELCRQIDRFGPAELMMLDRDESALHAVQLSLRGRALLDSPELILADLRDVEAIRAVFTDRRPEVVFHAAALKHLPLLERHPGEAVQTNIWGTQAVLEAAARSVERFVNISTDKAANPISVLGYSKRITERLTAYAGTVSDGTFLNVRFGNVLGSRGSVLTAFNAQIAAGGPITVTHPEVTRYFMTVQEAVQLVIQAAAIGRDGEALVLEMGQPVRIAEVARQLADSAESTVDIVYTGLRPGEKLHEELFAAGERDLRPLHPLISHVEVPPLDPEQVRYLDPYAAEDQLVKELAQLCDEGGPRIASLAPMPQRRAASLPTFDRKSLPTSDRESLPTSDRVRQALTQPSREAAP
jgi:FlaA1/EpsC-like NDP-sugar epimerase